MSAHLKIHLTDIEWKEFKIYPSHIIQHVYDVY